MVQWIVVLILFGVVVVIAARMGLHIDPENAPTGSPGWSGPDAASIGAALESRLAGVRTPPAPRHPKLDELASHHAFDMATRSFDGEATPEGEDLGGRRLRLHPELVGEAAQWQLLAPLETGWADAERALDALIGRDSPRGRALLDAIGGGEIGEVGIGAAVERGSVALCVVMMSRWCTLDDCAPAPDHDGVTFLGVLGPGVEAHEISARFRRDGGPWSGDAAGELEDEGHPAPGEPGRVRVHLGIPPDATGVEVQFGRRGIRGPVRRRG